MTVSAHSQHLQYMRCNFCCKYCYQPKNHFILFAVLKLLLCLAATIAASYLCETVIGEPILDPDFNKTCVIGGQTYGGR